MRYALLSGVLILSALAGSATAAPAEAPFNHQALQPCGEDYVRSGPWAVNWIPAPVSPAPWPAAFDIGATVGSDTPSADDQTAGRRRPVAFEYSDGYKKRNKIHKMASYATLPLFVTEYWIGAYMYANPDNITTGLQTTHRVVGTSLGVLFGVNTVTGVWNLIEARNDPNHKTKRTVHGMLMLAADAGFTAAAMMRPHQPIDNVDDYYHQRYVHRAIATTSMVVAGVSYLMMLFGRD